MLHPAQVRYFMLHGVKDSRICAIAQKHAELLLQGRDKFKRKIMWSRARYYASGTAGGVVGLSPYFAPVMWLALSR